MVVADTLTTSIPATSPRSAATAAILRRNNVHVTGQGRPLVLCNGFGCNQKIWHYLLSGLAARYQVVRFDYVGSGESDQAAYCPQKYATMAGYAQDVVEICQALDLRDAVLVGHSVGATIAMLAAIEAPQHFTKVVLLAPSPRYLNELPGYYGGFEHDDLLHIFDAMEADYHDWVSMFSGLLLGPANSASLGEELTRFFCESDPVIMQQFARVAFLSDYRAAVPHLRPPTLVLQCTDDVVGPEEVGAYLVANLPQGHLQKLRATGHCPHLSAPLETLAAIRDFVG